MWALREFNNAVILSFDYILFTCIIVSIFLYNYF
jgi:hypothetical protein